MSKRGWQDKKVGSGKNVAVVIGRFSPFHNGHLHVVETAAAENDYLVIVFGSARQARTFKSPWSDNNRVAMINQCFTERFGDKVQIRFAGVQDHYNDYHWEKDVVNKVIAAASLQPGDNVTLYGYEKDTSSYYLRMFQQAYEGVHWSFKAVDSVDNMHATDIRHLIFTEEKAGLKKCQGSLPETVYEYLQHNWLGSAEFAAMQKEYLFMQQYQEQFKGLKYAPTFLTVDTVIIAQRSVLLIRRKEMPGEGLWSLPGSFVGQHERLQEAAIRTAKQKAGIKLTEQQLIRSCYMDKPNRSLRGRTLTHAFLFELEKQPGSSKGEWHPISNIDVLEEHMFEDHVQIIERLCFN